jgi:hypothetical protein
MEFERIMNVLTSTRNYEEDLEMAPVGVLHQKPEGTATDFVDPVQGTKKRYSWTPWSLGIRGTKEGFNDDLYGILSKATKRLAVSARQTQEILGVAVLNSAFDNTVVGFKAGEALCETAHTLLNSGLTVSNKHATDASLGVAALQSLRIIMEKTVDEAAAPIPIRPSTLVIPPDLMNVAAEILRSAQKPFTGDNTVNILSGEFGFTVNHYLGSTTRYWLLAEEHDMNVFKRNRPEFSNGDDFPTGDALFKVYLREGSGYGDWRGVAGSDAS